MLASILYMGIEAKEIKIVPISKLKPNPKNRNTHSKEQLEYFKNIIENEGFRFPLTVSNQSGFIVCGHGRLMAAKQLGFTELPVVYQDFKSPEQEYRVGVADNALARQSFIDVSKIHVDLSDMDSFDVDLLGFKDWNFEPITDVEPKKQTKKEVECPNCNQTFVP